MKNKKKGLLAAYGMVLPAFLVVMLRIQEHLPQQTIPIFLRKRHRETT